MIWIKLYHIKLYYVSLIDQNCVMRCRVKRFYLLNKKYLASKIVLYIEPFNSEQFFVVFLFLEN